MNQTELKQYQQRIIALVEGGMRFFDAARKAQAEEAQKQRESNQPIREAQ